MSERSLRLKLGLFVLLALVLLGAMVTRGGVIAQMPTLQLAATLSRSFCTSRDSRLQAPCRSRRY
jgi:hypothetical protein